MKIFAYLFYHSLWVVLNIFLGYFYRHKRSKYSIGLENIPKDVPVLFCSNHPNAFMDALVLGTTVNRRNWFLARSDVFRKKQLAKFLSFLGIIPIYRLLEGVENLSKNNSTFDLCTDLLSKNKTIMVFSEGICIQERRLRKLKKGTARIAFAAEEQNDFKLNLVIVPVGINYSATPWKFRSRLHIRFGRPILVKDYSELYKNDKARAMNVFTRDLENKMSDQLVIISDPANDGLVAQLEEMFTRKWAEEEYRDPKNPSETFHISREITNLLKECENENPVRVASLREKVGIYFEKIKSIKTKDWVIEKSKSGKLKSGGIIFNYFIFLIFSPIWFFGTITNYIPYKIPYLISQRIVKNIEWHASVNATIAMFLWQFYWLLQSLIIALVFRNWYVLWAFMMLVPISGMIAYELFVFLKKTNGARRFLFSKNESAVLELRKMRMEIVEEVELLKEKFPMGKE